LSKAGKAAHEAPIMIVSSTREAEDENSYTIEAELQTGSKCLCLSKAKHHYGLLSLEFFWTIQECHAVFFLNSSKVRVRVMGLGAYLNQVDLQRIVGGEKASSTMVADVGAA